MSDDLNGAGQPNPPRLGEILVQRGLLTQERLEEALAEQRATNLPLGTILVRDGLVPTHTIAMALADQRGAPLKTEHGYATGYGASRSLQGGADVLPLVSPTSPDLDLSLSLSLAPRPVEAAPVELPPLLAEPVQPEPLEPPPAVEPPPSIVVELAPPEDPAAALRDELEHQSEMLSQMRSLLEESEGALAAAQAELESERAAALATAQPVDDLRDRIAMLEAERAQLEAALATARGEAEAHQDAAAAAHMLGEQTAADLRGRIAALEEEHARREEAAAERIPDPSFERTYPSDRHILFAPNGDRYELLERRGSAPELGSVVELSGHRQFRVVRIAPAPFPGAVEACAYLDQLS